MVTAGFGVSVLHASWQFRADRVGLNNGQNLVVTAGFGVSVLHAPWQFRADRVGLNNGQNLVVTAGLVVSVLHASWQFRGSFRLKRTERRLYVVRVMALCAYPPAFLGALFPITCAFTVYAVTPIAKYLAMALSAELLGLVKGYLCSAMVDKLITVGTAMAVQTPYRALTVL